MVATATEYKPDYAVPPGHTLRDTIEALDMTQAELARRTGISAKHINQVIQGIAPISPETALALEHVTGVPARLWNALEANYRQREARRELTELTTEDRSWLKALPTRDLVARGAIPAGQTEGRLFESMLSFFGVANRDAWNGVWLAPDAAFRRSAIFASNPYAIAAWLRLGELDAAKLRVSPFDRPRFRDALDEIRSLVRTHPNHYMPTIGHLCREAGVAFVVVPEIKGCRASGAARWLSPNKAILQVSLRYRWEDSFWFSFFHEAGHLMLHGKREAFVDDLGTEGDLELEADDFAGRMLIPQRFEGELRAITTLAEVQVFARKLHLPAGIVVGRLQREGKLDYAVGNRLRRRFVFGEAAEGPTRQ